MANTNSWKIKMRLLPQAIVLLLLIIGSLYTIFIHHHLALVLLLIIVILGILQIIFLTKRASADATRHTRQVLPTIEGPVAVMDVDFHNIPDKLTTSDRYQEAFILVRLGQIPVGQALINLVDSQISGKSLKEKILEAADWSFWERWVQEVVGWDPVKSSYTRQPSLTVAVCTRDRPDDLRNCLEGITHLPDLGQEVLVIDSASSTKSTRQICATYPQVRYVREDFPGLDRARNRAFLESTSEIIAFIDDDAVPDANWLSALLRNFADPRVYCVTGLTMPAELETAAQKWFESYSTFSRGFYRRIFEKNRLHPLAAGQAGAGVNMAFRRSVIELCGFFDEALDAGTPTYSGGDTEMFSRILSTGYQIVYDPAALSWHRHRRDWQSLRKTLFGYGCGTYAYWTRQLVTEGEWGVLVLAFQWAWHTQIPEILRSIFKFPGHFPIELLLEEIRGCFYGPFMYGLSRKQQKEHMKNGYVPYPKLSPS